MLEGPTIGEAMRRVLMACEDLASVAEADEEEWVYVNDLATAWRARLEACAAARGGEALAPIEQAAVERAIEEAGRISDPYRAVDWLSTFPQVVLTALGEQP
jgi:hypothetical protein